MASLLRISASFLAVLALLALTPLTTHAQSVNVFTVDDVGDDSDASKGDGICATSVGDCTLRAAIEEANATANADGPDRIEFSISTTSYISPSSPLPEITNPVVIDGTTAPSGTQPRLRIDGCSSCGDGLVISAGDSEVRGLQIIEFPGHGILITGGSNNVVEDCQIGDFLSLGSPAGRGNEGDGIHIEGGSIQNRIGDTNTDARNILSGNGGSGITVSGGDPGGTNNRIYGNYIGVAPDGETDLGNVDHGILFTNDTRFNVVGGGSTNDPGNVISGNGGSGIKVSGTFGNGTSSNTSNNKIYNNRIGLNDAGDTAVPNDEHGIDVDGATETRIGTVGANGNTISGNNQNGIRLFGTDVSVRGNYIGTDADGTVAIGNGTGAAGLLLVGGTSGTTVGGTSDAYRNVISGNQRGITLNSATDNAIEGNLIGVDRTGDAALGNDFEGIQLGGASQNNTIGGTDDGAGNVISGNGAEGLIITGSSATGNVVQGNHVGLDAEGDASLGNAEAGVLIEDNASSNTIGGTDSGARNVISGNDVGIDLRAGASDNDVQGNYIGTTADGTSALGNSHGISISYAGTSDNTIGGTAAGAGNVIAGNADQGVTILNSNGPNTFLGNAIGVDANGDPLGNGRTGIRISNSTNITVGGTASGAGNVIANNADGVKIVFDSSVNNSIRGNRIYANDAGLGIDLNNDGPTTNDDGDADDGPNRLQNFPEIVDAEYNAAADQVSVTYRVPSDPSASGDGASAYPLEIDFYKADDDEEEGAVYLGSTTYTASAYDNGPETWVGFTPAAPVTTDDKIVATATDADGNTSEFSAQSQQLPVELAAFEATVDGEAVRLTWQTASETNNTGFEVQRKVDGAAFFVIVGFVAGHGTTAEAQTYRFEDTDLPYDAERITYRLEQVDTDGTTEYSPDVEVNLGTPEALTLHGNHPNPARTTTAIRYALPRAVPVHLALYDMLGRQVAVLVDGEQPAGRTEVTVDTSTLPSGIYLYRLRAGTEVETRRMTIVK